MGSAFTHSMRIVLSLYGLVIFRLENLGVAEARGGLEALSLLIF
jgi:hypothetical protein